MNKEDRDKLDEYAQRELEWCLASGAITQYSEPGVVYPAAQNHWRNRKPWPFTEEESKHYLELEKALVAEAKELDDTPQHLLPFRLTGNWENFKFIK